MENIKFYSKYDMACGDEVSKIIKEFKNGNIQKKLGKYDINEILTLYNIKKYIEVEDIVSYINSKIAFNLENIKEYINKRIGYFFSENKKRLLTDYDMVNEEYKEDFFKLFEKFKIYNEISENEFKNFLNKDNVYIFNILELKNTVKHFNELIKENLMSDFNNAKIIIDESVNKSKLRLPSSLTMEDKQNLIEQYVDSERVNYNYLKDLENLPQNNVLKIPDKLKLKVKRKRKKLEETLFKEPIETQISVSYIPNKYKSKEFKESKNKFEIKFSRDWIEKNLDYPTLLNNFIYLFEFVDDKMQLNLDSKKEEQGKLERFILMKGEHLYTKSASFIHKEILSNLEMASYYQILKKFGIKIENIIEWFFKDYILEEFKVKDFIVKLPSDNLSCFEKCRVIIPEIDRILKQYNCLVKDNEIDQELIQISDLGGIKEKIKSFNRNKYVYSSSGWFNTATYLLFSDQSGIFYLPKLSARYHSFFHLVMNEKVRKKDFEKYQINSIKWLFDNHLLLEDSEGCLKFKNWNRIYILKTLYEKEVMNFWNYPEEIRNELLSLEKDKFINFENTLFSKNEKDYFDFNLNKVKFTNGYNIRNKYSHGAEENKKEQYENDYYIILKIIIIIIIKINDDLCIRDKNLNEKRS